MANNENLLWFNNQARRNQIRNNLMSLVEKPFDEALFLDNDQGHVDSVGTCSKITSVKVPGSDNMPAVSIRFTKEERPTHPYTKLIEALSPSGKQSAIVISRIILANGFDKSGKEHFDRQIEHLDVGSGINEETVSFLRNWVSERAGKKLAVLFDYDRTLTVIEGGFLLANSFGELKNFLKNLEITDPYNFKSYLDLLTPEGFTEYYVGGSERLAMLQAMFDFLYENNVALFLLTNNTACVRSKGMFKEILSILTKGRPVEILCGSQFDFDKKATIQRQLNLTPTAPLKALCVNSRGGRRTRKTKAKRKSKKTRKH